MKTISLYSGDKQVAFTFDESRIASDRATLLDQAKTLAKSGLLGRELSVDEAAAFEANLGRWMDGGFQGHFSLSKALSPADPSSVKRTSLVDVRTVGTEQELRNIKVSAVGLQYKDELASTKELSDKLVLAATGDKSEVAKSEWPLLKLHADQAHGDGKAIIEVVFGPLDVKQQAELERRARVTSLLQQAFAAKATTGEAVAHYNGLIDATGDAALARYKLDPKIDATVEIVKDSLPVQTNIEIPLKKIGDVADTTVPALFGRQEADDRAMFEQARRSAATLMKDVFRPTAAKVHGGAYEAGSIKLEKLQAVFTLLLYSVGKAKGMRQKGGALTDATMGSKGAWPILPKAGAGDLIREVLNVRDKLVLHHHVTKDWAKLEKALFTELQNVRNVRSFGKTITPDDREMMKLELEHLLKPGKEPARWGAEAAMYGKVDWTKDGWSGTITGAPIPTTYDYAKKLLVSKEPKIVLEIRRDSNPINAEAEHLTTKTPDKQKLDGSENYAKLTAAAAQPAAARQPKREVVV